MQVSWEFLNKGGNADAVELNCTLSAENYSTNVATRMFKKERESGREREGEGGRDCLTDLWIKILVLSCLTICPCENV